MMAFQILSALVDFVRYVIIYLILFFMALRAFVVLNTDKYYNKPFSLLVYSFWLTALVIALIGGITVC